MRGIEGPRRGARLVAAAFAAMLAAASARADEVPLAGLRDGAARKARVGEAFAVEGWEVEGNVAWGPRLGPERSPASLALARDAALSRLLTLEAPKAALPPGTEFAAGLWCGLLIAEARAEGPADAELKVTLRRRDDGSAFEARLELSGGGAPGRLLLATPPGGLVEGAWTLEISSSGAGGLRIHDLSLLRLPVDPSQMAFAKSNGPHGPDRCESGALGFAGQTIDDHAPLPVFMVREDGPAARAGLKPGDLVLGVAGAPLPRSSCKPGWEWFEQGHEAVLGRAVEAAMARAAAEGEEGDAAPSVDLEVLRDGALRTLSLRLAKRPPLPEGFPFDDEVTPRLYDDLMGFVRSTRNRRGIWANGGTDWIQTAFAGLALLGRRDPGDAEAIRDVADWFLERFPEPESFGNLGYWSASYSGIFLCEYLLATGDRRVVPWIERALHWIEAGFHTSKWGFPALGHGPGGLPYDQKALMAPAAHAIVFEALARRAGLRSGIWDELRPYMLHSWSDPEQGGHGAMGYNGSYRDQGEFWSRTGLFAMAAKLRDAEPAMRRAMVKIMAERHPWMRNSHAYGNPGDAWGLAGLAFCDRLAFAAVMKAWRPFFGGAWEPGFGLRHSTAHMGSPYMGEEGLVNPAFAMLLACRHRGLFLLGAPDADRGWLTLPERPAPRSRVLLRRDEAGRVVLRPAIPGATLLYTLDDSEPGPESPRYAAPLELPDGGIVQARALGGDGALGPVHRAEIGLPTAGWRVLSATGALRPEAAAARARALVDGDPSSPWQPDRGEGAPGLPYAVVLDMGSTQRLGGLRFVEGGMPARLGFAIGDDPEALEDAVTEHALEGRSGRLELGAPASGRYLRLEIRALAEGTGPRFGELLPLWPAIRVEPGEEGLKIAAGAPGLVVRGAFGGATPTARSEIVERLEPLALDGAGAPVPSGEAEGLVLLRQFDAEGRPVGPLRPLRARPAR